MKALLFTLVLLVGGDFAINHGDMTYHTIAAVQGFFHWFGDATSKSIFNG